MTRVLVAAASAVTRAGLEAILAREPSLTIVGRGAGAMSSLTEEVGEHEPDVVLVESVAHDDDLLTTLQSLSGAFDDESRPSAAVVVLTEEHNANHALRALRAGVRGLLPRNAGAQEIVAAVSAAAAGLTIVAREWSDALRGAFAEGREVPVVATANGAAVLSPRELEVLRMIADGLGNKQIAARLAISEHTVKFHVGSVFAKIGASTRAEAVVIGARRGLIVL